MVRTSGTFQVENANGPIERRKWFWPIRSGVMQWKVMRRVETVIKWMEYIRKKTSVRAAKMRHQPQLQMDYDP